MSQGKSILRFRSSGNLKLWGSLLSRGHAAPRGGCPQLSWGARDHVLWLSCCPVFSAAFLLSFSTESPQAVNLIKEIYWREESRRRRTNPGMAVRAETLTVSLSLQTILQGRPVPKSNWQHRINPWYSESFQLCFPLAFCCCCTDFFSVCLDFCFCGVLFVASCFKREKKKEKEKVEWIGRWGGSGKRWERGKTKLKYCRQTLIRKQAAHHSYAE